MPAILIFLIQQNIYSHKYTSHSLLTSTSFGSSLWQLANTSFNSILSAHFFSQQDLEHFVQLRERVNHAIITLILLFATKIPM